MKKIYKTLIILTIVVVNFISIIAGCITGTAKNTISNSTNIKNRLETIKEKGILTIASANERPFAYIDSKTGNFTGIDADIITEAARRLGINKVQMIITPFKYLITDLYNNTNIDMIASGIYITDERKENVLFTNAWYKDQETIIFLKSSDFNLKNAIIGAESGSLLLDLAEKWQQDGLVKDVKIYQSQSELLLALATSEVDAAVIDSAIASYILPIYENLGFIQLPSYEPKLPGLVAGAVRKGDTVLAEAINIKVDEMKKDGTLLAILKKYGLNESNFVSVRDDNISDK